MQLQLNGQVRYAQGGRPAEFVLVRLESFRGGVVGETTTDRSGKFRFSSLSPELYVVSVRAPGYSEVQQQVDLRTQVTDYIQLQLVPEVKAAKDVPANSRVVIDASVPQAARVEFEKGREAIFETKSLDNGILHLENAVRIHPRYLEALLLLGTAYMDKQDWMRAETTLRQFVALDPNIANAHFALGELYFRQKKYLEAENDMLAGIKLDFKSVHGHFLLGRLYYQQGNFAKAGPHVGRALQLNPNFARGHLLAANILLHVHQTENALVEFEEYLRLEPKGEFAEQTRQTVAKIKRRLP